MHIRHNQEQYNRLSEQNTDNSSNAKKCYHCRKENTNGAPKQDFMANLTLSKIPKLQKVCYKILKLGRVNKRSRFQKISLQNQLRLVHRHWFSQLGYFNFTTLKPLYTPFFCDLWDFPKKHLKTI